MEKDLEKVDYIEVNQGTHIKSLRARDGPYALLRLHRPKLRSSITNNEGFPPSWDHFYTISHRCRFLRKCKFAFLDQVDLPGFIPEIMEVHSVDDKASQRTVEGSLHKAASEVDVTVGLVVGHDDDAPVSAEESRRLRIKMDWHILPLLWMVYTRQSSRHPSAHRR